jgi:hypothetical protein
MPRNPATEPASELALDQFLSYRLHLVNKLTDKSSSDAYAQEFGLPVGEARCLAAIGKFAPLSVVELAARANLNKGQPRRAGAGRARPGQQAGQCLRRPRRGADADPVRPDLVAPCDAAGRAAQ